MIKIDDFKFKTHTTDQSVLQYPTLTNKIKKESNKNTPFEIETNFASKFNSRVFATQNHILSNGYQPYN